MLTSLIKREILSLAQQPAARPAPHAVKVALMILPPEVDNISEIRNLLMQVKKNARILEATAPYGKDALKQYRAFLRELMSVIGEPPVKWGMETAAETRLHKRLPSTCDFLIVNHAERLGRYSLDLLTHHPAFLVAYSDAILDVILYDARLLDQVVLLT